MIAFTYLLIELVTAMICLLISFDKRIRFYSRFRAAFKSIGIVAVPFLAWDICFTGKAVWWFSTRYTLGIPILGLPLEEWLFFICIPFCCLFTFYCMERLFNLDWTEKLQPYVILPSLFICIVISVAFHDRIYSCVTALVTTMTLIYLHFIAKVSWLGKASLVYLVLMPGFFLVNGLLTGAGLASPVVYYNPGEILNVRIFTIPVEDFAYGYTLFVLNVYFFVVFTKADTSHCFK